MTFPAVDDVQMFLSENGITDGSTDWPSVLRMMHDESDRLVVITEDGGPAPELPAAAGVGDSALADVGVRIVTRGSIDEIEEAQAKAQEIFDALHGQLNTTLGYTPYLRVRAFNAHPYFVQWDDRRRPVFSSAFRLARRVAVPSV